MKTLEKLSRKDKTNLVTKKNGNLTTLAVESIKKGFNCKFYPNYTSGSGRFTTNLTNDRVFIIIKLLGYKFKTGNDSPRGGKTGDYIKVSKRAFNTIKSLIN